MQQKNEIKYAYAYIIFYMTVNQRFEKLIKELYKGNKRAFSIAIDVAPTVIENIVGKRQGNPSFEVLQKTLSANANISAEWLILNIGSMLKTQNEVTQPNEWLFKRFEEIISENALLKREISELKSKITKPGNYKLHPDKSDDQLVAEPVP